ncbi:MAG: hypothetical protein NZ455_05040 [Bacteroidia bacterium]|nr:hypothetical protein [Bacteroidia bacterium]MDW8346447.1 hypothetical protein [Bacteroidia bacterium]
MRATKKQLQELETEVKSLGYTLRYEKGNFNGGYCIVKQNKVVVVNKFFSLEGKITVLNSIIEQIKINVLVEKTTESNTVNL